MIELYYTGSSKENLEQKDSYKSLGGYISSTRVPNGAVNNLFSNLSPLYLSNVKNESIVDYEIVGLGLKNASANTLNNVVFWVEKDISSICDYYISVVALSLDSNGHFMEKITNRNNLPYYATFFDINGVNNKKNIGEMALNTILGLWIKRIANKTKIIENQSSDALYDLWKKGSAPSIQENISLNISWS